MKILFITELGLHKTIESNFIPRIGDNVEMFFKPNPKVESVLHYPSEETLKGIASTDVEVIIAVS